MSWGGDRQWLVWSDWVPQTLQQKWGKVPVEDISDVDIEQPGTRQESGSRDLWKKRAVTGILIGIVAVLVWGTYSGGFSSNEEPEISGYPYPKKSRGIQTCKPYNIAHRGYSGIFPEHTLASYRAAVDFGGDFIECDVVATRAGELICFHDVFIDDITTDISLHPEFADRKSTRYFEGNNLTSFWVSDFTLAELRTLCVKQRWAADRPTSYDCKYEIPTFEEYIQVALNASRVVGIYPEIKSPAYNNLHVKFDDNRSFEEHFVWTLLKYSYGGKYLSKAWRKRPIFIQSFAPESLVRASELIDSPLIFLIDEFHKLTQDTHEDWYKITSDGYLQLLQSRCRGNLAGIGPWKDTILVPNVTTNTFPPTWTQAFPQSGTVKFENPNDLVERAHKLGLQVHPYTYRNEAFQLKWEYHSDPWNEYVRWNSDPKLRVDGFFTDFCETLYNVTRLAVPFHKGPAQ